MRPRRRGSEHHQEQHYRCPRERRCKFSFHIWLMFLLSYWDTRGLSHPTSSVRGLLTLHTAVGGMDGVPAVAQAGIAQREDFLAVGIMLGDETVVVAEFDTPAPAHGEAVAEHL